MSGPDLFAAAPPRARPEAPAVVPRAAAPTDGHVCVVCGERAGFGFDVFLRKGRQGRWACLKHRDQVEAMAE